MIEHKCDTSPRTESPATMNLVKRWIGALHEHPICQMNYSPSKEAFRPTRLLAVGEPNHLTCRGPTISKWPFTVRCSKLLLGRDNNANDASDPQNRCHEDFYLGP